MVQVTKSDIGKRVKYTPNTWTKPRDGAIVDYNGVMAFVHFDDNDKIEPISPVYLEWPDDDDILFLKPEPSPEGPHDDWDEQGACHCHVSPPCSWCFNAPEDGWIDPDSGMIWDTNEMDFKCP